MAKIKWDDAEYFEKDNLAEFDNKKQGKQRSRQWREVEQIKKHQKIRRERGIHPDYDKWV